MRVPLPVAMLVALLAMSIAGCSERQADEPARDAPAVSAPAPLPLERRIGWLHGNCLAIANDGVTRDTPLTVVNLGDEQTIADASVAGPTTSSDTCPALLEDRRSTNAKGLSFYEVRPAGGSAIELAIGVVGTVTRVGAGLDVSGDGAADQFTQCATSEGVSFAVWSGAPYQGTALWSAYYYLGYDTDATCPAAK